MAVIEKFLGQQVEIPEDLRYDVRQGLWGRCADGTIVFGFTQPALILSGGIKDIDCLVGENQTVSQGEAILFAITGKIMYLDAPVSGSVRFHQPVCSDPSRLAADPYGEGWLFLIEPEGGPDRPFQSLAPPETYLENLRRSEGCKNPEGIKGGVSGMCKAVYGGIGEQKI